MLIYCYDRKKNHHHHGTQNMESSEMWRVFIAFHMKIDFYCSRDMTHAQGASVYFDSVTFPGYNINIQCFRKFDQFSVIVAPFTKAIYAILLDFNSNSMATDLNDTAQ